MQSFIDAHPFMVTILAFPVGSAGQGWQYRLESEAAFIAGAYCSERRDPDTGLPVPA